MELSEQPLAVKNVVQFGLYVVVHEHWPVSQCMIVEMGDYAWSEHIVTVFFSYYHQERTVKGKTTPDSYTTPKSSCAQNMVVLK